MTPWQHRGGQRVGSDLRVHLGDSPRSEEGGQKSLIYSKMRMKLADYLHDGGAFYLCTSSSSYFHREGQSAGFLLPFT